MTMFISDGNVFILGGEKIKARSIFHSEFLKVSEVLIRLEGVIYIHAFGVEWSKSGFTFPLITVFGVNKVKGESNL